MRGNFWERGQSWGMGRGGRAGGGAACCAPHITKDSAVRELLDCHLHWYPLRPLLCDLRREREGRACNDGLVPELDTVLQPRGSSLWGGVWGAAPVRTPRGERARRLRGRLNRNSHHASTRSLFYPTRPPAHIRQTTNLRVAGKDVAAAPLPVITQDSSLTSRVPFGLRFNNRL